MDSFVCLIVKISQTIKPAPFKEDYQRSSSFSKLNIWVVLRFFFTPSFPPLEARVTDSSIISHNTRFYKNDLFELFYPIL